MNPLGKNIRHLRLKKKISPAQMREKCGITTPIELIEQGKADPGVKELMRLAEVLNFPLERLLYEDLSCCSKEFRNIRLLAMDVDGVLTDGGMYYSQSGDELKKFNTKDGMALIKMAEAGIPTAFISSGINDNIIQARAKMLKVPYVYVGTWKKLEILDKWCREMKIRREDVAYIGDDVNDLPVIRAVGFSACPSDAVDKVRNEVSVVLSHKGGDACVREFVDRYIMDIV